MTILAPRVTSVALLAACGGSGAATLGPAGDSAAVSTTGATDGDEPAPPTEDTAPNPSLLSFQVTCGGTTNALRFSCAIHVEPAQPVQIAFGPSDGSGRVRVHRSDAIATNHEIPLYLMAPQTAYGWTASPNAWPDAAVTGTVTTAAVPVPTIPKRIQVSGTSSVPYVGTHAPCAEAAVAAIYETGSGDLVWYEGVDLGGTFGWFDMIRFTEDQTILGETGSRVVEVDLVGNRLLELVHGVDYGENLHHDLFKKDGLVYTVFNEGFFGDPILDGFHVFDAATGARVATWRAADFLVIPPSATGDWMHTNTIWVDDAGDVYLSSYTQNTVIKLVGDWTRPDFGTQVWALAGASERGFGMSFDTDWSRVGGPDQFIHQHDIERIADGRLVLLDNWHGRGLVIALDEVGMTAVVEGTYAVSGGVCGPQGTANASPTGNLFFSCSGPDLLEFAPGVQSPVWEGQISCGGAFTNVIRWYALDW